MSVLWVVSMATQIRILLSRLFEIKFTLLVKKYREIRQTADNPDFD